MFVVDYYQDENGNKPVEEFLDSLEAKMRAKLVGRIKLLKVNGPQIGMPYSKYLEDGIFELRASQGSNITRVLYFFMHEEGAILTHGFIKKTQKTPRKEIERAKKIRADWKRQNG